jgi:hypothetical protein
MYHELTLSFEEISGPFLKIFKENDIERRFEYFDNKLV